MQKKRITETFTFLTEGKTETDQHYVRPGQLVSSGLSLNKTNWPPDVLERDASTFEGGYFWSNHPSLMEQFMQPERRVEQAMGRIRNVRLAWDRDEGKSRVLQADLHISKAEKDFVTKIDDGTITDLSIETWVDGEEDDEGVFNVSQILSSEHGVYPPSVAAVTYGAARGYIGPKMEKLLMQSLRTERPELFDGFLTEAVTPDEPDTDDQDTQPETTPAPALVARSTVDIAATLKRKFALSNKTMQDTKERYEKFGPKFLQRISQVMLSIQDDLINETITEAQYATVLQAAVDAEADYFASVVPHGMVGGLNSAPPEQVDNEQAIENLTSAYERLFGGNKAFAVESANRFSH